MFKLQNLFLIMVLGAAPTFAQQNTTTLFSPYVDLAVTWYPLDLVAVSQASGVKNFHLAFITDNGNCSPTWNGIRGQPVGWGFKKTDKMRENGIHYTIAFGGSGMDLSMTCDKSELITIFDNVVKTYQPDGLDFDIENTSANVEKLIPVVKQIQNMYPNLKISFTLYSLPEGLTVSGKDVIKQAKENNINFTVNIMAMNYGHDYNNNMSEYAIQASTNLFNFLKETYPTKTDSDLWAMIGVTSMIGVNQITNEQFTLRDADILRNFANQKHLGMLSIWSIERDNPCADEFPSSVCSGNNLQSKPYEFSERFIQ